MKITPNPAKQAQRDEIARLTAEYEAKNGAVQTSEIKPLSHDGLTKANGKTHLNLSSERPEIDPARTAASYRRGGKVGGSTSKRKREIVMESL